MDRDRTFETITEFLRSRGLAIVRRRAVGALGAAEESAAVRELAARLVAEVEATSDGTVASEIEDETTDQVPLEVIEHARALCRAPEGEAVAAIAPGTIQEAVAAICALPLQP